LDYLPKETVDILRKVNEMSNYWSIRVLTTDYIIEGQIDGSDILQKSIFSLANRNLDNLSAVTLGSIKMQSTGIQSIPTDTISTYTIAIPYGLIGVLPADENSLAEIEKGINSQDASSVGVIIGPYVIRGKIFVNPKYLQRSVALSGFTMKDVEIERLGEGNQGILFTEKAIVLTTHLLQGLWKLEK
jgi:hypothetical protein